MNHEFDFDQVGRRLPYSVPSGAFEAMEEAVMNRVRRQRTVRRRLWWCSAAAAAVVAAIAIGTMVQRPAEQPVVTTFDNVLAAYQNLSADDQDYLAQYYDNDLFMTYDEDYSE